MTRGCRASLRAYARKALGAAFFLGLTASIPSPATAEEEAAESDAETAQIVISEEACRAITQYHDTDWADYKPGVDAYGRPVVGADVGTGPTAVLPDQITFMLRVRLAEFVPGLPTSLADSSAPIGEVSVRDRAVLLNGKPLNPSQSNAVLVACRERLNEEAGE